MMYKLTRTKGIVIALCVAGLPLAGLPMGVSWSQEAALQGGIGHGVPASPSASDIGAPAGTPLPDDELPGNPGATSEESPPACLDWQLPTVDIIEGRFAQYGDMPSVRYAMAQMELGLGVVRTVIELSWRVATEQRTQTLLDATTAGDYAGGVSFYRSEDALVAEYLQCGWGNQECSPLALTYRYDLSSRSFVGNDRLSSDALLHMCKPVYFDSDRTLRRTRPH